jgi:transcription initiation factor TFIIB
MNQVGRSDTTVLDRCGLCRGEVLFDQGSGEIICTSCGAVSARSSEFFSAMSEITRSASSRRHERSNFLAEVSGVSTVIGGRDIDGRGQRLGQSRDLRQLRRLNTIISYDSRKRRLGKVSMEVSRVARSLGLSSLVAERAFEIYLRSFNSKSPRFRSLTAVAAASLCVACRELDIARPPNNVVALEAGVNKKQLRHYYRLLLGNESSGIVPEPANYVSSIAAKASLSGAIERTAIEIIAKVKGNPSLVGKRPTSIVAAALYLASVKGGQRSTQLRLAYAAGVTPITIRKRTLEISRILEASK